jgi:putative ABC transport system substrate-binding protein
VRRRDFIRVIAGSAAMWPLAARAQQPTLPVIGFLRNTSPAQRLVAAFQQGLKEAGYTENENVTVEYRWAHDRNDQMPALAADLVRRRVDVILAGGIPATFAAKAATQTIPIVFSIGGDPVSLGLVASLSHPGGNISGIAFLSTATFVEKRIEYLRELLPENASIAFLANPSTLNGAEETRMAQLTKVLGRCRS